jgi:hypothetical protein
LLRESERDVGVCRRLAGAMPDRRDPDHIQHQIIEMVTARVARRCTSSTSIDWKSLVISVCYREIPRRGCRWG